MTRTDKSFQKGYKFPVYPTQEQKALLEKTFGCCRKVYNLALHESKLEYEFYKAQKALGKLVKAPSVSGFSLADKLPGYKKMDELSYLREVSSVALQQSLLGLGSAYKNAFQKHGGLPKFKSKHARQSFTLMTNAFSFDDSGYLFIAKCSAPLHVVYSRKLPSTPSRCTISKEPTGQYYISFLCEVTPKKGTGEGKIGIDLGLSHFATLSTGEKIDNPRHFKSKQDRLRRVQQALARKKPGSSNRLKAKKVVAKVHAKIASARKDFLHKLSTRLVNENQVIGIEKLRVENMVKNHNLAKHIQDASWSTFTDMLIYKASFSQHSIIVQMDQFFPSSHICSRTGEKLGRKLGLSERTWDCPFCGEKHDRDINAAKNIYQKSMHTLESQDLQERAGALVLA